MRATALQLGARQSAIRLKRMAVVRLLLALLITWLILADCLLARTATPFPHPTAGIMLGLLLGEAGLIASWFACSRQHWLARLALGWLAMALLAWPAAMYSGPSWRQWAGLLLLFSGGVALGWKMVQASGWVWEWPTSLSTSTSSKLRSYQFSLAALMELMTTTAATLGLASWLALPDRQPLLAACSVLVLSALPPLCFWLALAETRSLWSRAGALLIIALLSAFFALLHVSSGLFATMLLLPGTLALVSLLAGTILSLGGGRLLSAKESKSWDALPSSPHPRVDAL